MTALGGSSLGGQIGQCLCGAVKVHGELRSGDVQACHCGQCQRWTGGGPLLAVRVQDLEIEAEAEIETYQASNHGERAFCRTCGSTLYWKMQGKPPSFVALGLLDDQSGLSVTEEIFVDYRPAWMPAWPDATQRTEADMLDALAAYLDGGAT
ncbi:MAG: GFA family protein [Pseudomonadota bacterium]